MTVRREKVILELEDNFTAGMGRATAATALFDKTLNHLSGSQVNTSRDSDLAGRAVRGLGDDIDKTSTKTRSASKEIDKYSGRLRLITEAVVTLGPALVPIGAVGIPALIGLTAGLGTAAGALGVTILAVKGLGDGLKALNAYQIEPTRANLEKMRAEMDKLGPSGAEFVRFLDSLEPELRGLQEVARAGFFPGVEDGLTALLGLMPQVRVIVFNLATEMGRLSAEAGRALSGDGFSAFFDYLETDAGPLLSAFSHTLGNVTQGFASMIVAFGPLSGDFASGMERMSKSFADWAAGLSQTQGFRDFVSYVRETGPQVIDLLGALATALIGILKAAAPVGQAVVPALTALARVLATIADSPIGPALFTAVAAMLALNRATVMATAGFTKLQAAAAASGSSMGKLGAGANFLAILTGIGAVNAAFSSLRDNIETADLDRNLAALARGETVADLGNLGKELANLGSTMTAVNDKFSDFLTLGIDTSELERSQQEIEKVDQALASMVESGQRDLADQAFTQIMAQARAAGVSAEDASKAFDSYRLALDNAGPSADEAAAAQKRYTQANNLSARVARQTRTQIDGLVSAMEEQTNAALGAFDAVTQYGNALAAAREAAKKGKRGIDETTEAGRENRDALSQLAGAWNNQSDAVRNNVEKWREARDAFIKTAVAMGVPEKKAKDLANSLMEIPRSVVVKMEARSDPALQAIARIKRELASVPRSISTTYYVNQINSANIRNAGGRDGDPSTPYASGGYTGPGHKYQPRGIVHADEVVLPSEIVRRDRSMLRSRYGFLPGMSNLPGYATGGLVGSTYASRSSVGLDPLTQAASMATGALLRNADANDKDRGSRKKFLEREQTLAEKSLEQMRERLDEERATLKAMREARKAFADSVKQNFMTDIFGGLDLEQAARDGLLGGDFMQKLTEYIRANNIEMTPGTNLSDYAGQYLQTLTPTQTAALQAQAGIGQLGLDTQNADEFRKVLRRLRKMGLKGGAYRELAASGDLAQAQAYLAMGPQGVQQLVQGYQERSQSLNALGNDAASVFNRGIEKQVRVTERVADASEAMRNHLREVEQSIKHLVTLERHRHERDEDAPERTGREVVKGISGAVTHGQQRGR